MAIEKTKRVVWSFAFFWGEIIDAFLDFPSFLMIIRGFPEKVPRLCKKLPRFSGNLRHFFQNFPRFSRKLPSFFLNIIPLLLRKRASLERNTPKIEEHRSYYPSIFLYHCVLRDNLWRLWKQKVRNCCMYARAFFMNAPLSPLSLAVLLEKQSVVLQFHFCNLERGTIVTSRHVVYSRVTYAYFFLCYICIKIIVQVLL